MLGDRLASSDNVTLKEQAQICYICSGNLNKMVESSDVEIQEIVELIVIMQKALEMQGIRDVQIEGKIANILSRYAEMLAAEGDLDAALNYLGNSQDEKIVMLKDRLCRALGYIEESKIVSKGPTMQNYYDRTRRSVQSVQNPLSGGPTRPFFDSNIAPTKQSFIPPPNQFNTQQQQQQQSFGIPPPLQPLQPTYASQSITQPMQPTQCMQSMQSMQSMQPMLYDQTSQPYTSTSISQSLPPPPPSNTSSGVGSRPPSVGPQARSKYIIDPSVKSTSTYGQSGFPQQTSPYNNQQIPPVPGYSSSNIYQPQVPMSTNTFPGQNLISNPKEVESFKPVQLSVLSPLQNQPQNQMYEAIRTQPLPQTGYGNENQSSIDRSNIYQPPLQPAGWNDPPAAKPSRIQVNIFIFLLY